MQKRRSRKSIRERERDRQTEDEETKWRSRSCLLTECTHSGNRFIRWPSQRHPASRLLLFPSFLSPSFFSLTLYSYPFNNQAPFFHFEPNVDCFNWSNHRQLWVFIHGKEGRKNPSLLPDALHALSVLSSSIVFVWLIRFFFLLLEWSTFQFVYLPVPRFLSSEDTIKHHFKMMGCLHTMTCFLLKSYIRLWKERTHLLKFWVSNDESVFPIETGIPW